MALQADRAAAEVGPYDTRIGGVERKLAVLTWMVGAVIGLSLLMRGSIAALWSKLGEIGGELGQLARSLQ